MIVGLYNEAIFDKLFLAKEPKYVSRSEFESTEYLYSGEELVVYSTKLNGERMRRRLRSVPGPSGNVKYDYEALGYMILEYQGTEFRTIVLDTVEKFVMNGQTYYIN